MRPSIRLVGCPGCSPEMQGAGITALRIKLQATGRNRIKTPWTRAQSELTEPSPAQASKVGGLRMSPHPLQQHLQERISVWGRG